MTRITLAILVLALAIVAYAVRSAPTQLPTRTIHITAAASDWGGGRSGYKVPIELVRVPAGRVTLTDENGKRTDHEIKAFWIGRTEVTWEQYDVFWQMLDQPNPWRRDNAVKVDRERSRPSKPYAPPDHGWGHDGFPAMAITFEAADTFCTWLSAHTARKFRIPTEAEWEYACRAGGPPVKPDAKSLTAVAWFDANSVVGVGQLAGEQTQRVATRQPNAWGLYDMLGNVAEYVVDPKAPRGYRVAGGSFQDDVDHVHSGAREAYSKAWQHDDPQEPRGRSWLSNAPHVGLRVVMEDDGATGE
jgi:formylglycine-generating enzyme required for sulfatase activity